mgnify:CR=1 FL=1
MPLVRLAGKDIELVVPSSYAARTEVAIAAHTMWRRALAAAIGLCWSAGSDRNPNRKYRYRGDVAEYGGQVMDHLHAIGCPDSEIRAAGAVALGLVNEGLIWEADIEDAVGNSEPAQGADGDSRGASPKSKPSAAGPRARSPR